MQQTSSSTDKQQRARLRFAVLIAVVFEQLITSHMRCRRLWHPWKESDTSVRTPPPVATHFVLRLALLHLWNLIRPKTESAIVSVLLWLFLLLDFFFGNLPIPQNSTMFSYTSVCWKVTYLKSASTWASKKRLASPRCRRKLEGFCWSAQTKSRGPIL